MEPSKVAQSVDDIVPLRAILRERALLIPRGWLVVQSAAGGVQMVFALVQRPHRWATFVLGGACLVLLAVWSLAEQRIAFSDETAESGPSKSRFGWRVVRGVSAVLGVTTLFVFLSAMMSGWIGTWIS